MQTQERDFQIEAMTQLRNDLVTLLRNRSYELLEVEKKRADLQETVRKLNLDVCAVDIVLKHLEGS